MKLTKNLTSIAAGSALLIGGMAAPIAAQAETSASMAFSNMYLWRGQNVSPNGAVISGSFDYNHENGFYAGIWMSSEDEGHETDIYAGYAGKAGPVDYDVSYWNYIYPENGGTGPGTGLGDTDAAEIVVSASFQDFSAAYYMQVDSDNPDDNYLTLSYSFGDFNLTYGMWMLDAGTVASTPASQTAGTPDGSDEYTHLTLSYSATDELSFAVSIAQSDLSDSDGANKEEDPLFQITYSKSFDLSKK